MLKVKLYMSEKYKPTQDEITEAENTMKELGLEERSDEQKQESEKRYKLLSRAIFAESERLGEEAKPRLWNKLERVLRSDVLDKKVLERVVHEYIIIKELELFSEFGIDKRQRTREGGSWRGEQALTALGVGVSFYDMGMDIQDSKNRVSDAVEKALHNEDESNSL